jgi:hypothetical protein
MLTDNLADDDGLQFIHNLLHNFLSIFTDNGNIKSKAEYLSDLVSFFNTPSDCLNDHSPLSWLAVNPLCHNLDASDPLSVCSCLCFTV